MARFDVYRHPDAGLRVKTPYLLDIQNDYIAGMDTRVVLPIRTLKALPLPMRDLNPLLEINGAQAVLDAAAIAAVPASELRTPVANLRGQADVILNALDTLFGSY